jgi:hypothetical protein
VFFFFHTFLCEERRGVPTHPTRMELGGRWDGMSWRVVACRVVSWRTSWTLMIRAALRRVVMRVRWRAKVTCYMMVMGVGWFKLVGCPSRVGRRVESFKIPATAASRASLPPLSVLSFFSRWLTHPAVLRPSRHGPRRVDPDQLRPVYGDGARPALSGARSFVCPTQNNVYCVLYHSECFFFVFPFQLNYVCACACDAYDTIQ